MNTLIQRLIPIAAAVSMVIASTAHAAVQLSSTRVIFNEKDKSASIYAKNHGSDPFVVQTWIDGDAEEMETPFFVTPPLSRFDGNAERSLVITKVGKQTLQGDRETYYWLNVLEIPQKKAEGPENSLTLATRTRIKLFYRPTAIQELPRGPELAQWSWLKDGKQCRLAVRNTSAFTINFSAIDIAGEPAGFGKTVVATPLATTEIPLSKCPTGAFKATAQVVNDYGAVDAWPEVMVQPAAAASSGVQQ